MSLEEIPPDGAAPLETMEKPIKCLDTVIALYDFPGTQPSHLPLFLGDTVYVLSKHESGWWDGCVQADGELSRGWFPSNYVRLVNYVQPVLAQMRPAEEIDSLTAANTAANVLIPLFTSLLQKSVDLKRSNANLRKNSVVSFASLENSDRARHEHRPERYERPDTLRSTATQQLTALTISYNPVSEPHSECDYIRITPVEEAEAVAAEIKKTQNRSLLWIPRLTTGGDLVYYCELVDMYTECLPLVPLLASVHYQTATIEVPTQEALVLQQLVSHEQERDALRLNSSIKPFDPLKRDSTASASSASTFHHFQQALYNAPGLFYLHLTDFSRWLELLTSFEYLLDLTWKALREYSRQLFAMHLSQLAKVVTIVLCASRLSQDDFACSKYELSVRRRLKRIWEAFAQLYINGLLHLAMMHQTSIPSRTESTDSDTDRLRSLAGSSTTQTHTMADATYADIIEHEVDVLKKNMNNLVKLLIRLTKNKRVSPKDYDSSDVSDDEGIERYDLLPQIYPRLIANEFNGGNWCNPFFANEHSFLNLSGDQLKNKYHLKVIIDNAALERANVYVGELAKVSNDTLAYLDPAIQHKFFKELLRDERNEQISRLVYRYLHQASSLMDLLELFDFTVFCLVKRYLSGDSVEEKKEKQEMTPASSLTFDYPVVLEFFQHKQTLHDLIAKIVIYTQLLTLEDPEVFAAMKEDDLVFYNRDIMKNPLEKSTLLLSQILTKQNTRKAPDAIQVDVELALSDLFHEGMDLCDTVLSVVQQLIEERETILNYATRVMHDDINVELLVVERNNTAAGDKSEHTGGHYFSGKSANDDTPWYLEGDEMYDLLLDINGNIKGGTKEALVAHLTHHDVLDSDFNTAFIITITTMSTMLEFLQLLINRFNMEAPEGLSYEEYLKWKTQKQSKIRHKVLNIMKLVLENHWCQLYHNKALLQRWHAFVNLPLVQPYPMARTISEDIKRILNGEILNPPTEPPILTGKSPALILKGFSLMKLRLHDIDAVELARQLTLREFELYRKISKHSCIHKVWGKKSGLTEDTSAISDFIKALNQLTNFVAYKIIQKEESRKRVQIIRYFVLVAEKCRQYNNFSSMTAIISALYSSPIHRLKKTWLFVLRDTMAQLQNMNKLMNSSRNFTEYRDMLKFLGSEACVPFFGVYLSDLTFIYHGNPDHLLNRTRMINFAKRAKTVDIVMGIDRFKRFGYNFQPVGEIQKYLDRWFEKLPTIEEQYELSLQLEPREPSDRKPPRRSTSTSQPQNVNMPTTLPTSAVFKHRSTMPQLSVLQ